MDLAFTPEEQAFREQIRAWVRDNLCFPIAGGSFEDGMGA